MPSDSKFTRDDDGNVAVRVVSNTGVSEQPESMFTTDEDGNVAVRVVFGEGGGGGGGDSHNKGYFATPEALRTAYPTAQPGDFAIVESTDTVWVWDSDTNNWKDGDTKGQVTSVNNQTGAVTVQATLVSGTNIKTVNNTSLLGSGNITIDSLPTQAGNSGKFLTTDGSSASWATVDALPTQTGNAGKFLVTDGTDASWSDTVGQPLYIKSAGLHYTGIVELKGYNNNNDILQINMMPSTGTFEIDVRNNSNARTGYYRFDSAISPVQNTYTLGKSTNVWANVFTAKINNGADIAVPNVAGELAVKQVNTTITLTAAGWSSNTQTVNVTGMTATGVVMVSPDPTDQSAYTSAGILCTAQAAGTLTFTCDTVPSADIDVNVVML